MNNLYKGVDYMIVDGITIIAHNEPNKEQFAKKIEEIIKKIEETYST